MIPSVIGLPWIEECLRALQAQAGIQEVEIIVVDCSPPGTAEHIRTHFPDVKLLRFSERLSIPELRFIGIGKATGEIVAILAEHCVVHGNWLEELIRAHESGYPVVGGAIENGNVERILDWAVFLCEYSQVMPPIPNGETNVLPGYNVSYTREILQSLHAATGKNSWEYFLHQELRNRGIKFLAVPTLVVQHKKRSSFLHFLTQRFHFSRSFAGMRRNQVSNPMRIFLTLLSPLLPFLMIERIAQNVFQKKRYRKEFLQALPLLIFFMISYAAGECIGYATGPGESLLKVE